MPQDHGENDLVFHTDEGSAPRFFLRSLTAHEAISTVSSYQLVLEADFIDDGMIEKLLAAKAYLAFGESETIKIHGRLTSFEIASINTTRHVAVYRAEMAPRLWNLSLTSRTRVFQNQSVLEIVRTVLTDHGLGADDFKFHATATHPTREYTVQYEETDLAFISRLLEYEGMFYFFEQVDDVERLVIGDANTVFEPIRGHETIPYRPIVGVTDPVESIQSFARKRSVLPRTVRVRDYNYRTPSVALDASATVDPKGLGERVGFGEHPHDPRNTQRIADLRAQEIKVGQWTCTGSSTVRGLHPGQKFAMSEHVLADLDKEYVVIDATHRVVQGAGAEESVGYTNTFTAIPTTTPYRPPLRTPRPEIPGVIHGRIDGEVVGAAAPIDELGRYRVTLMIDPGAKTGGKASRPIRMAQLTAGAGFGTHFPLHIGTEVLIAHIDGDPDRPVIVASVADRQTVTPVTREQATQSIIRTRGQIEIHLDDDA